MIRGNERINGAEERWRQYREEITEYTNQEFSPGGCVLVLGAGACDDIELETLLRRYEEVWLVDVNGETMQEAMSKIRYTNGALLSGVRILETDLTGITEQDYETYETALRQGIIALYQWWEDYFKHLQVTGGYLRDVRTAMMQAGIERMENTICLGLHSQLYMRLVLHTKEMQEQLPEEVCTAAYACIREANGKMAHLFMDELQKLSNQLMLGLEYTTIFPLEDTLEEEILQALEEAGSVGLHHLQLPRVEGALQMETEVGTFLREQRINLKDYRYFLWPFLEEKHYLMVIFSILCYN